MSELPGKKRSADLNRRLEKKETPFSKENPFAELPKEDEAVAAAKPRGRQTLKKSDRDVPPLASTGSAKDAFEDDFASLSHGSEDVAPEKRKSFGSGEVIFTPAGDLAAADVAMEDNWSGDAAEKSSLPLPLFWIVVSGLVLLAGLVGIVVSQRMDRGPVVVPTLATEEQLYQEEVFDKGARAEVEAIYAQLQERLKSFLEAETLEEKAQFVRHPERVRPLMESYYQVNEMDVVEGAELVVFEPATLEGFAYWVTAIVDEGKRVPILIEQTPDNQLLIDWETSVGYQEHDWNKIVTMKPEGSYTFRVRAFPSDFHVYEFKDRKEWAVARLSGRGGDEEIYGFFRRDAPFANTLIDRVNRNRGNAAVIATLSFPQDSKTKRAAVIESVESYNWVYTVDPDAREEEESQP